MPAAKRAQLVCESFAVLCPYCGAEQANELGSEMWMPEDMNKSAGRRECNSCEAPIVIFPDKSAIINWCKTTGG